MGDNDDDDDRSHTQRLVAELAEVRRRMSRRAMPAVRPRADGSVGPVPALSKIPTDRIVIEDEDTPPPLTQRIPQKPSP